jgi:Cof subfamily protein (haloacid dehalogenase superfamily)
MYKLIFIDIDGTLLTSDHIISKGTLSAIERVSNVHHIPVILATARPPQAIEKIYNQLCLHSPAVCFNGALILDRNTTGNFYFLQTSTIDSNFLNPIYNTALQFSVNISFYKEDQWFTNQHDYWIQQEEQITETKAIITNISLQIDQWINENNGPNKILLMGAPDEIDKVELALKNATHHQLNIYKSKPTYLEIMNNTASKKAAIHFLLNKYNLSYENVLAFGDNFNDIEMLQLAGVGIAMGNAPVAVQACADFVTLSNDAEGIQFALDKFIQ